MKTAAPFIVLGAAFIVMGANGPRPFLAVGVVFLLIGLVRPLRGRR